jgi:hypothetical protein
MRGWMNTIRLLLLRLVLRVRNNSPTSGMRPSSGTRCSAFVELSWIRPPSTRVPPSLISTLVVMVRLLVMMSEAVTAVEAMLELSTWILSSTASPWLICGVTVSSVPTAWRWMVWKALVVPVVPVYWPVMKGTSCATSILASWLSCVWIEGVAMMLVRESPCSARTIAAKLMPVAESRPMPIVVPSGSLPEATVPDLAAVYRSMIEVPPTGSMKPPAARLLFEPSTTQLTPSSADLSAETSTMIACTSTCMRRMSSLSTTALRARMVRWPAVITSELVALSAQMVALPPSSERVAGPPPPAAGAAGWEGPRAAEAPPVPESWPLSRVARSSASA